VTTPAPHEVADVAELSAVVRRVLGTPEAQVVTWEHQVLYGGGGALSGLSGVHRFAGSARAGDRTLPWSAVLKVIGAPSGDADAATGVGDPRHADYWQREARAFEAGLLDALPTGLAAPRCFGVAERPEGVRIWMEEVSDTVGAPWPLRRFGVAARHLGRFNGAYLAGRPVPAYPWLGQGLLRARADRNARFWATVDAVRSAPLFRRGWPADLADRALRLFQERHTFLDLLDRLPQTLRHGDADRRNLLARDAPGGDEQTVAIDWAYLGTGAVGEEVAPLVASSVLWGKGVAPRDLPDLEATAFDGYLVGLRDAGWHGDPRLARLGCEAAMALRYGPLLGVVQVVNATPEQRAAAERTLGEPLEHFFDRYAALQHFVLDRAESVRALAPLV
jgi:hypothetical protein